MNPNKAEHSPIALLERELSVAQQALREPGAGARSNLECRVASLQEQLLSTPTGSIGDIATRLQVARDIVLSLGPRGYLLDLIEACIADLRKRADEPRPPEVPSPVENVQRTGKAGG